jgi:hypothetical protein
MKQFIISMSLICYACFLHAQKYPEPEFANEVYYLKKDSVNSVVRLEKGSSKMETKAKLGGFGGSESGYMLDGVKSGVRLHSGSSLSFVFSTGASVKTSAGNSAERDSMMRANGMDPAMMSGMGDMNSMSDPSNSITLYKAETAKGKRKILMMKSAGASPFGSKKMGSDKYTFSVKKIREGYWELVIDKTLPKGEYAFSIMSMTSMDGSTTMFAFAVD